IFMSLAAVCWVAYGFLTRSLLERYDRMEVTFWQALFGLAGFIPFALSETVPWGSITWFTALNVLYLGVFGSALANLFYVTGMATLGPAVANVYINLIPVVSVAASFLLLGERLAPLQAAGGAIVLAGALLATGPAAPGQGSSPLRPLSKALGGSVSTRPT
ncbi:MAG TPA: DMT family transporter, partial [Magnetospirillaceae bacterium]|nr:DMT family transporter [Magnetospirillaceae bacterium]